MRIKTTFAISILLSSLIGVAPASAVLSFPGPTAIVVDAGADSQTIDVNWTGIDVSGIPAGYEFGSYSVSLIDVTGGANTEMTVKAASDQLRWSFNAAYGVINGSQYKAKVRANFVKTGASDVGNAFAISDSYAIPYGVPAAPAKPTVSRTGAGEITVRWIAPDSNGNAISSYTVSCLRNVADAVCAVPSYTVSGAEFKVVTGLTFNFGYSFTVVAVNARGSSDASEASATVVPYADPAGPSAVTLSSDLSSITASWGAVAVSGTTVDSYSAQLYRVGTNVLVEQKTVSSGTSVRFTNLPEDTNYYVKVVTTAGGLTSTATTSLNKATLKSPPPPPPTTNLIPTPTGGAASSSAPAPATPKMAPKAKIAGASLATQIGMEVPAKAKVALKVAGSSKKFCKVSGGKIVALKPGNCAVTISVTPKKTKLVKKPVKSVKNTTITIS